MPIENEGRAGWLAQEAYLCTSGRTNGRDCGARYGH